MPTEKPKRHAPKGPIKARDHMDGSDHMDTPRCTATAKGTRKRCKRRPIPGGTVCVKHGGGAPQVQQKALERLEAYQHQAIGRLFELVEQTGFPSTALSAVKDVLDRTMGKPTETQDIRFFGELNIVDRLRAARERLARQKHGKKTH